MIGKDDNLQCLEPIKYKLLSFLINPVHVKYPRKAWIWGRRWIRCHLMEEKRYFWTLEDDYHTKESTYERPIEYESEDVIEDDSDSQCGSH